MYGKMSVEEYFRTNYITATFALKRLRITRKQLMDLIKCGRIEAVFIYGAWRLHKGYLAKLSISKIVRQLKIINRYDLYEK